MCEKKAFVKTPFIIIVFQMVSIFRSQACPGGFLSNGYLMSMPEIMWRRSILCHQIKIIRE